MVARNYERVKTKGFVYMVLSHYGFYKVGASIRPYQRLQRIRKQKERERIYLAHLFPADDMILAESILQSRFREKNYYHDWFRLDLPEIDFFQSIAEYRDGKFITLGESKR